MRRQQSDSTGGPFFSIVVPVHDGRRHLAQCLRSVQDSNFTDRELIVVDDGSSDGSTTLAAQFGATVLWSDERRGPAAARNRGARRARGTYLFFLDADCRLHADTLARAARVLRRDPELDALFGSYDDEPAAPNLVSQYKNLFHHYVHQTSDADAVTFWAGCGAIARDRFIALGGFDAQRYRRPCIEDIELGYRLTRAGGRVRLAKGVQVTHLKRWSFLGLLKTDVFDRGIPWTRLLLERRAFAADLNLQTHNRVSVVTVYALLASIVVGRLRRFGIGLLGLLVALNLDLYRFFARKRGFGFTVRAIPLHWLYYLYNGVAFACGLALYVWDQTWRRDGERFVISD